MVLMVLENSVKGLVNDFSRLDKTLGFCFLRNSSGPTYFNDLNNQLRPQIKLKSFALIKKIWPQCWNVWELEDNILLDVWYENGDPSETGDFNNDQRQAIRLRLMENLESRLLTFKAHLSKLSNDQLNNLINCKTLDMFFDEPENWMAKAGFYINKTTEKKKKERIQNLICTGENNSTNTTKLLINNRISKPTKLSASDLQRKKKSMLERIRAKEKGQKDRSGSIEAAKQKKENQKITDQFKRLYSILYEQAPKFNEGTVGLTVSKLQKLVGDSVITGIEGSDILQTVQQLGKCVSGISIVKVGELEVIKIGKLNREEDLQRLNSNTP